MNALALSDVRKSFGTHLAVGGLDFSVEQGEIFGFLGANGAGKTTTIKMVLDIIRPDSGLIEVFGSRPGLRNAAKIGFLPEERGLYRRMTAHETVSYFGRLKGMSAKDAGRAAADLLDRFEISSRSHTTIDRLSKGLAQKVQIATALVNRPALLLLDEPFSGLDPVNQALLEALILEAASGGAAVVFSTHVMQHAERLCSRLLLLVKGRKIFEGTLAEARQTQPVRLYVVGQPGFSATDGIAQCKVIDDLANGWQQWEVTLKDHADPALLLEACTRRGVPLREFTIQNPSLHDIFIDLSDKDSGGQ